jgi:16S rRNA (guanine527-N7)-methyltransferase
MTWPASSWTLLDANGRRGRFLRRALAELGLAERVEVWIGRAEELGRDPGRRGAFDLVVARGFGPPAVTAECGAPFLAVGGSLVVSEPPGGDAGRWPAEGLATVGLSLEGNPSPAVMRAVQGTPCPARFPRRSPAKRPLF